MSQNSPDCQPQPDSVKMIVSRLLKIMGVGEGNRQWGKKNESQTLDFFPLPIPFFPLPVPIFPEWLMPDLDNIAVRGARVNNLKNISFAIPVNSLTVVTGVSGSGKSSLAFDTVYAEGQRRYVE